MPEKELQRKSSHHYIHSKNHKWTTKIMPGEFYATANDEMLVTVLGSCIAACIYDEQTGLGGMNHFMLPHSEDGKWAGNSLATRYGNFAMEHLINELLKKGALKERLRAKIYGGGDCISSTRKTVGNANIDFVREYLKVEKIKILDEDLGGNCSRKIYFTPNNGQTTVKKIHIKNDTIREREDRYEHELEVNKIDNDIELF
tara:strand:+ start:119143 stop:119745 length:603 start_codon:yes stop_codon:yes gene_type:complete